MQIYFKRVAINNPKKRQNILKIVPRLESANISSWSNFSITTIIFLMKFEQKTQF